jgi:transposase-like protein
MPTIAELKTAVERIWHASSGSLLHDALESQLRASALVGVKATLEAALAEELTAALGFPAYARLSAGAKPPEQQRAGSFSRSVLTSYGSIPSLRVPKLRRGNQAREWRILTRYQRLANRTLDQLLYLYELGLSMRDLQEALYVLLGSTLSRQAVMRVTDSVEQTLQAWRSEPLSQTPPFLIVDGVWVTILYPTGASFTDRSGHVRAQVRGSERVILAVLAVWPDGRHHILHYMVAEAEDKRSWSNLWQALLSRGLDPQQVRLVVSDGSKGVQETLRRQLPKAHLQRCVVHKVRSFERNLRYADLERLDPISQQPLTEEQARVQRKNAISADALAVFQASNRQEAEALLAAFVAKWQECERQAVKTFRHGLARCFSFYECDPVLHPLLRSTNLLERFFREFRARADEMGAFANETSCLLVFHLVMIREHAKHDRLDFAQTG